MKGSIENIKGFWRLGRLELISTDQSFMICWKQVIKWECKK